MKMNYNQKYKGKGLRKCQICGGSRALIRSYHLYICRRCFREASKDLGFEKL